MTTQEVLDGLTNDLILRRLRKFLVSKGLPDGKYLLAAATLNTERQGRLELVLPKKNRKLCDEQSSEDVRVVIDFGCPCKLASDLTLDIRTTKTPIRRGKELIYRFSGVLRPLEEQTA